MSIIEGLSSSIGSAVAAPSIEAAGGSLASTASTFIHTPSISLDTQALFNPAEFSNPVGGFKPMLAPDLGRTNLAPEANLLNFPEFKLDISSLPEPKINLADPAKAAPRFDFQRLAELEPIESVEVGDGLTFDLPGFRKAEPIAPKAEITPTPEPVFVNIDAKVDSQDIIPEVSIPNSKSEIPLAEKKPEAVLVTPIVEETSAEAVKFDQIIEAATAPPVQPIIVEAPANIYEQVSAQVEPEIFAPMEVLEQNPVLVEAWKILEDSGFETKPDDPKVIELSERLAETRQILEAAMAEPELANKVEPETSIEVAVSPQVETETLVVTATEVQPTVKEAIALKTRIKELEEKATDMEEKVLKEEIRNKETNQTEKRYWFFLDEEALGSRYEAAVLALRRVIEDGAEEIDGQEIVFRMPGENSKVRSEVLIGTPFNDFSYFEYTEGIKGLKDIKSVAEALNHIAQINFEKPPIRVAEVGKAVTEPDIKRVLRSQDVSLESSVYAGLLNEYLKVQLELSYLTERASGVKILNTVESQSGLEKVTNK